MVVLVKHLIILYLFQKYIRYLFSFSRINWGVEIKEGAGNVFKLDKQGATIICAQKDTGLG